MGGGEGWGKPDAQRRRAAQRSGDESDSGLPSNRDSAPLHNRTHSNRESAPLNRAPLNGDKAFFFEKKKQKTSDILLGERTN